MTKKIVGLLVALVLTLPCAAFAATTGTYIDYRMINVDQDYSKADYSGIPLYDFTPNITKYNGPNPIFPINISLGPANAGNVTNYLTLKPLSGEVQLLYASNIGETNFNIMSANCPTIASHSDVIQSCSEVNGDPNLLRYDFTYTGQSTSAAGVAGGTVILPILVNNGLRARSVDELVAARSNPGQTYLDGVSIPPLDYFEVTSNPADFTASNPTPIVALPDYFADPAGTWSSVNFYFDALPFCVGYTAGSADANACSGNPGVYLYDASATAAYPTAAYLTPVSSSLRAKPYKRSLSGPALPLPYNVVLSANCSATNCSISAKWSQPSGDHLQFAIYDPMAQTIVSDTSVSAQNTGVNSANVTLTTGQGNYQILLTPVQNGQTGSSSYEATDFSTGNVAPPAVTQIQLASSPNGCTSHPTFYIGTQWGVPAYPSGYSVPAPYLYGQNLCAGLYQINITAVGPYNELAHATFYVNVSSANKQPGLSAWLAGADASSTGSGVATTSLLAPPYKTKAFIPLYIYAGAEDDPAKDLNSLEQLMTSYASDIGSTTTSASINHTYLTTNPISDVLSEIEDLQFATGAASWPLLPAPYFNASAFNADPRSWLGYGGINIVPMDPNATNTPADYMPQLTSTFGNVGVGFIPDYGWPSVVKSFMQSANDTEIDLTAQLVAQLSLDYSNATGASFDLEAGLDSPSVVQWFKATADRLAYRGRTFSAFDFPEQFPAQIVAAMGPLGVALFSEYDAGQLRAPQGSGSDVSMPYLFGYEQQGWDSTSTGTLFSNSIFNSSTVACTTPGNPPAPISWCALSSQDQVANNNNRFRTTITGYPNSGSLSPATSMAAYNGRFVPILAVSAAATSRDYVELWYPDLSTGGVSDLPNVLRQVGCKDLATGEVLNNAWFAKYNADLQTSGTDAYNSLSACLFQTTKINNGTVPVQTFKPCGFIPNGETTCNFTFSGQPSNVTMSETACPYNECILISAIPGMVPDSSGTGSTIAAGNYTQFIQAFTVPKCAGTVWAPGSSCTPGSSVGAPVYAPYDQHMLGYGFFALEATEGSQAWGEVNGQQAEPWYAGGPNLTGDASEYQGSVVHYDPYYYTTEGKNELASIWTAAGVGEANIFTQISS